LIEDGFEGSPSYPQVKAKAEYLTGYIEHAADVKHISAIQRLLLLDCVMSYRDSVHDCVKREKSHSR
jgi:hypothetical protein